MKVLGKISLHSLEEKSLSDYSMSGLKGGATCTCGGHYANGGGSSSGWNDATNYCDGKESYGGGSESCGCCSSEGVKLSDFWKG